MEQLGNLEDILEGKVGVLPHKTVCVPCRFSPVQTAMERCMAKQQSWSQTRTPEYSAECCQGASSIPASGPTWCHPYNGYSRIQGTGPWTLAALHNTSRDKDWIKGDKDWATLRLGNPQRGLFFCAEALAMRGVKAAPQPCIMACDLGDAKVRLASSSKCPKKYSACIHRQVEPAELP